MRVSSLLLGAVLALACTTPTRLYTGPERPVSEIAQLRESYKGRAQVYAIDQEIVFGSEWHIAPGPHEIWVKSTIRAMGGTYLALSNYCLLSLEAAAGSVYEVEAGAYGGPSALSSGQLQIGASIRDTATQGRSRVVRCVAQQPKIQE